MLLYYQAQNVIISRGMQHKAWSYMDVFLGNYSKVQELPFSGSRAQAQQ